MSGRRLAVESSGEVPLATLLKEGVRGSPDVAAFASREGRTVSIMVWHYHDDDVVGPEAAVALRVAGLPRDVPAARVTHHRIDERHSNAYGEWKRMGSPIAPNEQAYAQLQRASELATLGPPEDVRLTGGTGEISFMLPRQGVSLLVVEWGDRAN